MSETQPPLYEWVDKSIWIYDKHELPMIIQRETVPTSQPSQITNEAYHLLLKSEKEENTPITEDMEADYRTKSYSGFKKADTRKKLIQSILEGNMEGSLYWCSEMVCSGYFLEIWDTIFYVLCKNIYTANPKLPYLIYNRYQQFKNIVLTTDDNSWVGREIQLRNHKKMRNIFAELSIILCLSQKRHPVQEFKIPSSDFDMINLSSKMCAKSRGTDILNRVFRQGDDPPELYLPLLEFTYSIYYERNWLKSIYWFNWILEFEKICIRRKDYATCKCYNRFEIVPTDSNVNIKYAVDVIWLIWEIIDIIVMDIQVSTTPIYQTLYSTFSPSQAKKSGSLTHKIINTLKSLFCIRYNPSQKRKRRYMLYFVFGLLCEPMNTEIPFCNQPDKMKTIIEKIGNVYKYIQQDVIKHHKKEIVMYKPEALSKSEIKERTHTKKLTKKEEKEMKEKEISVKMSYLLKL
jgi:hypothetical protein